MAYYKDIREYLEVLEAKGLLVKISRPINKDTELHPLVRLQYRGLPESERKAFLFENVTDSQARKYDIPVAVGCMAASRDIYAAGMMCPVEEISERWVQAQLHPLAPRLVASGPVQEVVHREDELDKDGAGLEMLPIPISTPGFDIAPYLTSGHWVTKDPETGIRNMGNYRAMVKSRTRLGCWAGRNQGIAGHWRKCKEKGVPMEAAVVLGVKPNISYVAVTRLPEDMDELAVAGALVGEPVELVKCKTVDLEVPANAEIVLEGTIPVDSLESEGPFGEFTGYMGQRTMSMYFNLKCITQRRRPIYQAIISQFPPSESRKLHHISWEAVTYKYLTVDCGIPGILEVALPEESGGWGYCIIKMKKQHVEDSQRVLDAITKLRRFNSKVVVVVDEDINARDAEAINWAISFRMQPNRDIRVVEVAGLNLDPSVVDPSRDKLAGPMFQNKASSLLIDATRKWPYPPVSLPKKEFMDRALEIWRSEGLPELHLNDPWFGYSLGYWSAEEEEQAQLALQGRHYITGERFAREREKV